MQKKKKKNAEKINPRVSKTSYNKITLLRKYAKCNRNQDLSKTISKGIIK